MKRIARSARRRRYIKAWISGEGVSNHQCSVSDVSDDGMKVISIMADKIPDMFSVEFNPTSPKNGLYHVVWRKASSLGAKFVR
jgi:hypothetical protein